MLAIESRRDLTRDEFYRRRALEDELERRQVEGENVPVV
jgi:hypothetical protein